MKTIIGAWVVVAASMAFVGCAEAPVDETFAAGAAALSGDAGAGTEASAPVSDETVAIFRSYNPKKHDHVQGTTKDEGNPADGWIHEGEVFRVYVAPAPGRVALRRCYVPATWQHFLSTDARCESEDGRGPFGDEGVLGWVSTRPGAGKKLYRCYAPENGDHVTTTTPGECQNFRLEGDTGAFVP